jgi:hypothetical protein
MDDFEKALQDAPFNSDLLSQGMTARFPGVRSAYTTDQMRALLAAGYKLRAITRNPFFPEEVKPHLYLSPATPEEKQERGMGTALTDMVTGRDMRRAGLRR